MRVFAHLRGSGNLRHAGRLYHRRTPLAIGEFRRFFLIGVDSPEGLAIGVIHGNEVMMVTAATVFSELRLLIPHRLAGCFRS